MKPRVNRLLRAKLYSYKVKEYKDSKAKKEEYISVTLSGKIRVKINTKEDDDVKEEKKCKGIKKEVIKKSISFDDYKYCLFNNKSKIRKMNVIRSHLHDIYTETVHKVALSYKEDKRHKRRWYPHLCSWSL